MKEEGGGVALSSLWPRYHALCLQWMFHNDEAYNNQSLFLNFMVHVLQGVKAKVPFPQFHLNHGGDNPNYSLVVELLGTSKNRRFMRHSIKAERLSKLQSTTHVALAWS